MKGINDIHDIDDIDYIHDINDVHDRIGLHDIHDIPHLNDIRYIHDNRTFGIFIVSVIRLSQLQFFLFSSYLCSISIFTSCIFSISVI